MLWQTNKISSKDNRAASRSLRSKASRISSRDSSAVKIRPLQGSPLTSGSLVNRNQADNTTVRKTHRKKIQRGSRAVSAMSKKARSGAPPNWTILLLARRPRPIASWPFLFSRASRERPRVSSRGVSQTSQCRQPFSTAPTSGARYRVAVLSIWYRYRRRCLHKEPDRPDQCGRTILRCVGTPKSFLGFTTNTK